MPHLTATPESWPIRGSFAIARGSVTAVEVVVAELADGAHRGRGECRPYARYDEMVAGVTELFGRVSSALESQGLDRSRLQELWPPGAARNALDCAFWDLEAKRSGRRAWQLAGLDPPQPVVTAFTLSLDTPDAMGRAAAEAAGRPLLKIKLDGEQVVERLTAVRHHAPEARLVVDANEAWTPALYAEVAPMLAGLGVEMIEQPLPAGADQALAGLDRPVKVCADESCHDSSSLPALEGLYDMVNIKLDKTGGLTEALKLKAAAEAEGFGIMVGCMLATSLSMAPAVLLAQGAEVVDLDGPLLLAEDRVPGLRFDDSVIHPPEPELWG